MTEQHMYKINMLKFVLIVYQFSLRVMIIYIYYIFLKVYVSVAYKKQKTPHVEKPVTC